jgi:hypothetical protein
MGKPAKGGSTPKQTPHGKRKTEDAAEPSPRYLNCPHKTALSTALWDSHVLRRFSQFRDSLIELWLLLRMKAARMEEEDFVRGGYGGPTDQDRENVKKIDIPRSLFSVCADTMQGKPRLTTRMRLSWQR